jgi:hypothetical protein
MFDADWLGPLAAWVDGYEDGIPLVNIASDNVSHEKLLLKSWRKYRSLVEHGRAFIRSPRNGSCTATCGCWR